MKLRSSSNQGGSRTPRIGRPPPAWCMTFVALVAGACWPGGTDSDYALLRPNGDLLAAGDTVERSETVSGDAMLAGGNISFSGDVGGSYLGLGGYQEVRGRVEGSGRAAGGTVRFGASVGRNVTLAGGNVELLDDALVERNGYLAGGYVQVDGSVGGDLYVGAREVVLDGPVDGDVRVEADILRVGPSARIGGGLRYRVGTEPASIDPDAEIAGEVEVLPAREDAGPSPIVMFILRVLGFVLCGSVVVALFPGPASAMVDAARRRPVVALGLGLLWLFGVPAITVAIAITLIGLPLALMLAAAYAASIYLAPAVPAMWLGELLVESRAGSERANRLRSFLVGGPLLGIAVFLPWAGFILRLVAGLLGLGAMALVIRQRWK